MSGEWRILADVPRTALALTATEILMERLAERGHRAALRWGHSDPAANLALSLDAGIGADGFRIDRPDADGPWRLAGGDERGLLYGIGAFLRGCHQTVSADEAGPTFRGKTGVSKPRLPVRGIYFATHFHNFYHDAPLDRVERYVADLALWGCSTLSVWFDMHHYTGIQDPAAQKMIERLHAILKAANRVGLGASLTSIANEAYSTSPPELRAEPFPHHYHVEICPSRPGGLDLILKWRAEVLQAFADLDIESFWIWPHDQGGCRCEACKPWGGNGFVRNAEAVARLVRRMLPRTRTVVSTWEFGYWQGEEEWDRFYEAMARHPDWVDYVMAEHHGDYPAYVLKHGAPGGFPLLNFPEISMFGMYPWGGFGANVQPRRLQQVWKSCRHLLSGGFPYSEGIFEDLNKAICLQLYWDPDRPVEDIVREYAAAEFGPETAEDVCRAVYLLEANMAHQLADREQLGKWAKAEDAGAALYQLKAATEPEKPLGLLDRAAKAIPPACAASWRWRMLWLRAALDAELIRSGGRPTEQSDAWFEEVERLSCAQGALLAVSAPSRRALRRLFASA